MPRTLAEWLALQQRGHPRGIDLGLERIRPVAERLGLLPAPFRSILVGGTNGKGSTVAHLDAMTREAGLRVGTFTSPHLVRYSERVRIDGREAQEAELVAAFERIEAARGATNLTFFEYNTLAAFELFVRARVDVAVVEVGLGGRLDATNILDADVAVLCSVGLDHCEWLGDTVEKIGGEKAGIFRRGQPVVLGSEQMPQSVHGAIAELAADARWPGRDFHVERRAGPDASSGVWSFRGRRWRFEALPPPALAGEIQYANAAAAIAALEALPGVAQLAPGLDAATVGRALSQVRLPGRFQIVPGEVEWILDVAHNPPAAKVLAAALSARPVRGRTLGVCAMLGDKDAGAVGAALAPVIDAWVLGGIAEPRGLEAAALAARLPLQCRIAAQEPDVRAACAAARDRAAPGDRIVVFGSFHTVGPALEWLGLY
jgi:dihydrofolate synthase/folylpolyglutamate synthase